MKTINLAESDINNLSKKNISGFNSESDIYVFNRSIIKVFSSDFVLANKKKIINSFDLNRRVITENLEEVVLPEFYLNIDKKFSGYGMPFIAGNSLKEILESSDVSFKDKKKYLVKLGEFLEKMKLVRNKGLELYINDLQSSNVICLPNGNIKIVDSDSFSIGKIPTIDAYYLNQPYFSRMYKLKKYNSSLETIKANDQSDLFCYIMIVLEFLSGKNLAFMKYENYNYWVKKLKDEKISDELVNIFLEVYSDELNENPYMLLKSMI